MFISLLASIYFSPPERQGTEYLSAIVIDQDEKSIYKANICSTVPSQSPF